MSISNLFQPNNYDLYCKSIIGVTGTFNVDLPTTTNRLVKFTNTTGTCANSSWDENNICGVSGAQTLYSKTLLMPTLLAPTLSGNTVFSDIFNDSTPEIIPLGIGVSGTVRRWINYVDTGSSQALFSKYFNQTPDSPCVFQGLAPGSAGATGMAGQLTWDSSFIYICTAANTWKRVAIATW